jgi:hypothetical protein
MQNYQANRAGLTAYAPPDWDQLPDLGLYMDQVITYMERQCRTLYPVAGSILTPSMINNYVKCGLVKRPVGKKYDRVQLAQLMMLCILKQVASLEEMKLLMTPLPGEDTQGLYAAFCKTQESVFESLSSRPPEATAMQYAIEAAAFRSLCAQKLAAQQAKAQAVDKKSAESLKQQPDTQERG